MQIDASDPSEDAAPVSEDGASRAATAQVKRIAETAQFASMGFPSVGWKHDPVIRKILREAGLILAQDIRNNFECYVDDSHDLVQVTLERVIPDKGQAEYKNLGMHRGLSVEVARLYERRHQLKDSRNNEEEARALEDDDGGEDDDRDRFPSNQYENMSDRHSEFSTSSSSKRRQESKEEALFRRQLTKDRHGYGVHRRLLCCYLWHSGRA